jgi:hypothetical protein
VKDRQSLPNVKELCEGIASDSPLEHMIICPVCGQMFDCREQEQVAHHSKPVHEAKLR